jgi:outer membrane protein assembly factor BamD
MAVGDTRLVTWNAWRLAGALTLAVAAASACAPTVRNTVPPGTSQPDQFLFERGTEALNEKRWLPAREYFKEVTETYTQSPYRPDAKLGVGDTYLGEGTPEALVLALNEFQEFLAFYPTHPRADYAQYKIGMTHHRQMRSAGRDQTETRAAVTSFEAFLTRYPNSKLRPEAEARLREARDRVGEHEYGVGRYYYTIRWYPAAIERWKALLKQDPAYSGRDAVYFFLGESLIKMGNSPEALPYFEMLVTEFEQSEHLEDARARIAQLKTTAAANTGKPSS